MTGDLWSAPAMTVGELRRALASLDEDMPLRVLTDLPDRHDYENTWTITKAEVEQLVVNWGVPPQVFYPGRAYLQLVARLEENDSTVRMEPATASGRQKVLEMDISRALSECWSSTLAKEGIPEQNEDMDRVSTMLAQGLGELPGSEPQELMRHPAIHEVASMLTRRIAHAEGCHAAVGPEADRQRKDARDRGRRALEELLMLLLPRVRRETGTTG